MVTNKTINNTIFYLKVATSFKIISRSEGSTTKPSHNRIILTKWQKEEVDVFPATPK